MVYKMIISRKERRIEENYLDLTLIELFDTMVNINLPSFIIKHIQRELLKGHKKAHALRYGFWLASIIKDYEIPMQV